jgi:hypothetical protein
MSPQKLRVGWDLETRRNETKRNESIRDQFQSESKVKISKSIDHAEFNQGKSPLSTFLAPIQYNMTTAVEEPTTTTSNTPLRRLYPGSHVEVGL